MYRYIDIRNIYTYIYVSVYIFLYIHIIYIYISTYYIYVHTYMHIYTYINIPTYIGIIICMCMRACIDVRVSRLECFGAFCVCMYIYALCVVPISCLCSSSSITNATLACNITLSLEESSLYATSCIRACRNRPTV